MNTGFAPAWLERRYAVVDECPEHLLPQLVSMRDGTLFDRAAGIGRWRDALLAGVLPPPGEWPPEAVAGPVRLALDELALARFCKGEPALVDALLGDLLTSIARQADAFSAAVSARLRELECLERIRLGEEEQANARGEKRRAGPVRLHPTAGGRLQDEARREVVQRARPADEVLLAEWGPRARAWAEVAAVFGDLGLALGRGWDMAAGVLRHTGWLDLVRLRALVAQLPQLRAIVQALGRLHTPREDATIAETVIAPFRRLEEIRREIRVPGVAAETRGVERSDELSRMLPVEAAMLGHPTLRLLWHARRAERALLSYRVEGVEAERTWAERDGHEERREHRPRPRRGPILAVIDTSGSMQGPPEQVAKAIVLEALRTAHAENRRCLLYTYGGPGEVAEHELDLSDAGIGRLVAFLGLSFGGGSDESAVMNRVLVRLRDEAWHHADVLFVSDGEWPLRDELAAAVRQARDAGTRFHGVQVGNRGRTGLHALCDPVYEFQDWAAAGGWA